MGPDKTLTGAALGAAWGVGTGAVVGNQFDHSGKGMATGAALGAVAGAVTGGGLDLQEGSDLQQRMEIDAMHHQVAANRHAISQVAYALDSEAVGSAIVSGSTVVYFDKGIAAIRFGTAAQLERIADAVTSSTKGLKLELHGHTDDTGDVEENKKLSEARSRTVASFLAQHGVSTDRIKIVSHGAEQAVASNATESGRQLNRRVEVVVVN